MIKLNLCIGKGDCKEIPFESVLEMADFLNELYRFDCIWLATDNGEFGEQLITEDLTLLINSVTGDFFKELYNNNALFFVQEYQTYEDAYKVALNMREGNPKCYN
jgi:hypothetical protein